MLKSSRHRTRAEAGSDHARRLAWLPALLLVACATAGGPAPEREAPTLRADVDAAVAALSEAEAAYDAGRYERAATAADSLVQAWRSDSALRSLVDRALMLEARAREASGLLGRAGEAYRAVLDRVRQGPLREEAVTRYAGVLGRTGREGEAVDLVLSNPGMLAAPGLEELRRWTAALSLTQVQAAAERVPPTTIEARIVHVQLAQLLAAAGDAGAAEEVARGVLEAGATDPERSMAELIASGEVGAASGTTRVGAILPLSGELEVVGELLRRGIELALEGRPAAAGRPVEVLYRDDGSDPERAAALVPELEREGVVAILGPLRSESFAAAARARRNPRLPILSPTATEVFASGPNLYTLNDREQREADVAAGLARWTIEELGLRRAAILVPADPVGSRAAASFETAFETEGGEVVATAGYHPDSTTFARPIRALAAAAPDVVFTPVTDPRTVLTLAPQLSYYGLDRSIVLGDDEWADPAVFRRLEPFAADYRVLGMWVDRVSPGTAWQRFVNEYERAYRESLRDNLLPALAHDAMSLVLAGLEATGLPLPAALARYFEAGPLVSGVTGELRPDPATSTVRRPVRVRMILEGRLVPADRSVLLGWLTEARARPREPDGPPR